MTLVALIDATMTDLGGRGITPMCFMPTQADHDALIDEMIKTWPEMAALPERPVAILHLHTDWGLIAVQKPTPLVTVSGFIYETKTGAGQVNHHWTPLAS